MSINIVYKLSVFVAEPQCTAGSTCTCLPQYTGDECADGKTCISSSTCTWRLWWQPKFFRVVLNDIMWVWDWYGRQTMLLSLAIYLSHVVSSTCYLVHVSCFNAWMCKLLLFATLKMVCWVHCKGALGRVLMLHVHCTWLCTVHV